MALGDRTAARDDWDSQKLSREEMIRGVRVYVGKQAPAGGRAERAER
jgi:hypothetical protein